MLLKGSVRLKKASGRFTKSGCPWVFSNELVKIDKSIVPGSWVSLEGPGGQPLAYGHFNPHSLIAFRAFERVPVRTDEEVRAVFFKRLDDALRLRRRVYFDVMSAGVMGKHSFRLAFGESDGVPGLVIDLYEAGEGGLAVLQCHSAGADNFISWAQQWLSERLQISCGVVRNDIDVRRRENAKLEVIEWGNMGQGAHALEGGVRFFVDPVKGQKTGYFYDHRDNRREFARRISQVDGNCLDCFSYMGGWGLQALKQNAHLRLTAVDVSKTALDALKQNAEASGLANRVEAIQLDFFKERDRLPQQSFAAVISDPPALTSSAKQASEGKRAHTACFEAAVKLTAPGGLTALASCSYHLGWDDFLDTVSRAGLAAGRGLKLSYVGAQAADHPILAALPETRYLKCVFAEQMG